ncbi:hypothetical protein HDU99_005543, partial [Rhizoclosmatium hyalinum]
MLWCDDTNPDLDPVRHLLVFIYLMGSTSGYLCVKGVSTDIKEHISYDSFLKTFQAACHCQLAAIRPDATWGLHTFRKTGYLFSEWANAPYAQARVAARHRTDHNSIKYSRDAATLKEIAKQNGTLMELEWKAPYVADRQQALSHNTMRSLVPDNLRDLSSLSKLFVESYCKRIKPASVANSRAPELGVSITIQSALAFRTPESEKEKLQLFVNGLQLPDAVKLQFQSLIALFIVSLRATSSTVPPTSSTPSILHMPQLPPPPSLTTLQPHIEPAAPSPVADDQQSESSTFNAPPTVPAPEQENSTAPATSSPSTHIPTPPPSPPEPAATTVRILIASSNQPPA